MGTHEEIMRFNERMERYENQMVVCSICGEIVGDLYYDDLEHPNVWVLCEDCEEADDE